MIHKLEMLIALAKARHFGRAAESLGLTQPTLSSGIRQLEDELGVKLVTRGARFRGLTPEGERALVMARQIVGDARRLREEMRFAREGLSGELRLGVIPTALTRASDLATRFAEAHPGVRLSIRSRNSHEILAMIDDLDADAGITYLDNEPLGRVAQLPLYRERYALVCGEDHPLAGRESVAWSDLARQRFCLLTPDMQNRRIIDRSFLEAGVTAMPALESSSTVVLVSTVLSGGWVTVLPREMAAFLAKGHPLSVVPITGGVAAPGVGLVTQYQEPQTPLIRALFEVAERAAGEEPVDID